MVRGVKGLIFCGPVDLFCILKLMDLSFQDLVPLGTDTSRHTTLGLLNKAKHFIKVIIENLRFIYYGVAAIKIRLGCYRVKAHAGKRAKNNSV